MEQPHWETVGLFLKVTLIIWPSYSTPFIVSKRNEEYVYPKTCTWVHMSVYRSYMHNIKSKTKLKLTKMSVSKWINKCVLIYSTKYNEILIVWLLSHVHLFVTLWTIALEAPLSMGFYWQEHWSGLPCPPPGDFLHPGIETASPAWQADSLPLSHWRSP